MKISGYGAKQVNKEKIKQTSEQKNTKSTPLKNGENYKGKLTAVEGDKVKVNINGKEYSATINNGSLGGRGVGDQIELKVIVNGSDMLIDIKSEEGALSVKGLDNLLMNLGVSKTDENKAIINILKEFKIPITKENFEEIKSFIKSKNLMINTLSKNIENNTVTADLTKVINKELGLKENLLNIFKAESGSVNAESSNSSTNVELLLENTQKNSANLNTTNEISNRGVLSESIVDKSNENTEQKQIDNNTGKNNEAKSFDLKDGLSLTKELANTKEVSSKEIRTNTKLEVVQNEVTDSKNTKVNQKNIDNTLVNTKELSLNNKNEETKGLLKIIDSLKNVDESTFAFNKEMQIPNVVKNLIGFDNLINMKNSVVSQLRNVLDVALEHGDDKAKLTAILEELIGVKSDDFEKLESILNKTKDSIETQKTPLIDILKEDIGLLKESIDYIKEVNNQVVYMQTPIDVNGEIRDFEMGIKKSKNSKDGSFKIFISLETESIGLVQSLIKIKDTDIEIGFKVEEEFDDYFSDNHTLMAEELTSLGYTKIKLSNIIREKKLNLTDLIKNDVKKDSQFDFLV